MNGLMKSITPLVISNKSDRVVKRKIPQVKRRVTYKFIVK